MGRNAIIVAAAAGATLINGGASNGASDAVSGQNNDGVVERCYVLMQRQTLCTAREPDSMNREERELAVTTDLKHFIKEIPTIGSMILKSLSYDTRQSILNQPDATYLNENNRGPLTFSETTLSNWKKWIQSVKNVKTENSVPSVVSENLLLTLFHKLFLLRLACVTRLHVMSEIDRVKQIKMPKVQVADYKKILESLQKALTEVTTTYTELYKEVEALLKQCRAPCA